jgi:hypothetical protein
MGKTVNVNVHFGRENSRETVIYIAVTCRGLSPCQFLPALRYAMVQEMQIAVTAMIQGTQYKCITQRNLTIFTLAYGIFRCVI